MKKHRWLALASALGLAGCNPPASPVGNEDIQQVPSANEIDANTAVSVVGPEGNATNAAAAVLTPSRQGSPDYNVSGLDARHDEERGNLGGRPGDR
jgi:hypothetical protein